MNSFLVEASLSHFSPPCTPIMVTFQEVGALGNPHYIAHLNIIPTGRYLLIIRNGSSMLQISLMHGMALAVTSEVPESTMACQTSQLLGYFPCRCLRMPTRPPQTSALSFHFYHHCLEGPLGFHETCILPSSRKPRASTGQLWLQHLCISCQPSGAKNCSSRSQDECLEERSQWSRQRALQDTLNQGAQGRGCVLTAKSREKAELGALPGGRACSGPQSTGKI